MNRPILVDTPVWSASLRKAKDAPEKLVDELCRIIRSQLAVLIGPIRQELLSGIKDTKVFDRLRRELSAFPDHEILTSDYETAARFFNLCRSKGIQGSNTDFLICALAARNDFQVFTTDRDFYRYSTLLPIRLFELRDIIDA